MEKVPTAQNFFRGNDENEPWTGDIEDAMIEFAKLHVKEALKNAVNTAIYHESIDEILANDYEESLKMAINRCYPETNII